MKDSGIEWLGPVPADWKVLPVRALFKSSNTKGDKDDSHLTPSQKYGVLTQVDYMKKSGSRVVVVSGDSPNMKQVLSGDFISHLRSFQGGLELSKISGKVSGAYTVIRPIRHLAEDYFKWLFKSSAYVQGLQTTTDQLRDGQTIRMDQLSFLPLPYPEISEQTTIASYLDQETSKIDLLISKKEQLIEKLLERRQALITQVVTKGLDPDVPMKDSGIEWLGRVPKTWDVIPLKRLVKLNPETLNEFTEPSEEIHYIEIGNVSLAAGIEGWTAIPNGDAPSRARRVVREGDVLISTVRTYLKAIGRVVSIPTYGKLVASTGFAALRPLGVDSRFLELAIAADSFIGKIQANSVGVSYPGIDASRLISFKIAMPPTAEQTVISTYLDTELSQIGKLISRSKSAIELLRERRQALITQVVTGKLDVRGLSDGDS